MQVQPMEVTCEITAAEHRMGPNGPSINVTYSCQYSQHPVHSFCTNEDLFGLPEAVKPVTKTLLLTPAKLKDNKPDDGVFYNYWWNIVREATGGQSADAPAAPARPPQGNGQPATGPETRSDQTWWSWGQKLASEERSKAETNRSIQLQVALKESRLATEYLLTTNPGEALSPQVYGSMLRPIFEAMVKMMQEVEVEVDEVVI